MDQDKKRYISYICPKCRQSVIVAKDLFTLAAAPNRIKCPCGKSELRIDFMPNRVQLEVPCVYCGHEHQVSCPSHAFVRERALAFSCAVSGLDCCYVGEEGPVYAATARLEQALDKLEAVIQHNESDLSTWIPSEYELNRTYAFDRVTFSEYMMGLRELILEDTEKKIADGK